MKKKAISLLLVAAMVLSFALVAAPAVEATEQQHATHCTCGEDLGTCTGKYVNHKTLTNSDNIEWEPWPGIVDNGGKAYANVTEGHYYYLTDDVLREKDANGTDYANIIVNKAITLCLNGHTFSNKLEVNADLTITDCSATPGKIVSYDSGSGRQGGVLQIKAGTVNLFNAKLVYAGDGVKFGGVVAINADNCTFNMYSGELSGGNATQSSGLGGTIYVGDGATRVFNMYGGTVQGGTAKEGGNIYVRGKGTLNIKSGTIYSGTVSTTGTGTAIHTQVDSPENITYEGGSIIGGASGNVISYNNEETISLGITKMGLEIAENGSVGVGYITEFAMTDGMKAKLATSAEWNNSAYGLKVWVEGGTPQYASFGVDQDATVSSTHLKNIMNKDDNTVDDAANSIIPVKGVAYAVIGKTVVESATRSFTLKTLVEKMDANLTDDASLAILKDLYAFYENVMSGWTLTKINAA